MTLALDIPAEKQVEILATLKLQHADLVTRGLITSPAIAPTLPSMSCRMIASAPSYYFCNNLFAAAQAYASTRVMLKVNGDVVKTSVHVKRNGQGDLMDAVVLKGPSYKLKPSTVPSDNLTLHASTSLFNAYTTILHTLHESLVTDALAAPVLPAEVLQVKFDPAATIAAALPLFPKPVPVAPVATPVFVAEVAASSIVSEERSPKRQRTGARSTCYICYKHKTCDILFPCRVASHGCCRKCIKRLYEMWSSDEFEGKATIKCPQCGRKDGLIERADGKTIWLGSRYMFRKKRRLSYAPVDVVF